MSIPSKLRRMFKKILLLGEEDYYTSFSKIFIFFTTQIFLFIIVYKGIVFMADYYGFEVVWPNSTTTIPTVLTVTLGRLVRDELNKALLTFLSLVYGYIYLFMFSFSKIGMFIKMVLGGRPDLNGYEK